MTPDMETYRMKLKMIAEEIQEIMDNLPFHATLTTDYREWLAAIDKDKYPEARREMGHDWTFAKRNGNTIRLSHRYLDLNLEVTVKSNWLTENLPQTTGPRCENNPYGV